MATAASDIHVKLFNAVTGYDRQQSTKKGYNPYALGHYAKALGNVKWYTENGFPLRKAIITCFTGRLCDKLLRAVDLPVMTRDEARFGLVRRLPAVPSDDESWMN